jgi:hypothetical protein
LEIKLKRAKCLATKSLTTNQLSFSENALELTYGNIEFQNFPGRTPDPRSKGREKGRRGNSGREERRGGRGGGGKKGRAEEKERDGKGERNLDPSPDVPNRSTPLDAAQFA